MTSLTAARTWPFLTRRTRPGVAGPARPATRTAHLTLEHPDATPSRDPLSLDRPDATPAPADISSAPALTRHTELTATNPAVRLTRRQSAIGTLRIDGATAVGWETTDRWHGVSLANSKIEAGPEHANRHLIERTGPTTVLVNARHIHELRRLIIASSSDQKITLTTAGGTTARCTGTMYVHRLGDIIELRAEPATDDIGNDYGI